MEHDHDNAALAAVLVTGGGSGIGAELARQLADRGCNVIISGRRPDRLADVAAHSPGTITPVQGDVVDPAHRRELVDAFAAAPGPRGVFHGAGTFQTGVLTDLTADEWRRSLHVNVEARWALSVACASHLDDGRVLFIGSDAGVNPRVGAGAYSIAQSASETLRRVLQAEWAGTTRSVGAFKPGLVDTDMVRGFMAKSTNEFPARDDYLEYIDAGRLASAQSVAEFARWLLLDVSAAEFATTEWDIRDESHHQRWASSPLYPDVRS